MQREREMKLNPKSESEVQRLSRRSLLPPGVVPARIVEAVEKESKARRDMIELAVVVTDAAGDERTLRDWLTNSALGAAKLRHACEAVGALAKYESGEIGQADFPGHDVRVKIGVEKKRGYEPRNVIEDYEPADSGVVNLRAVGRE
jgi:hypothetical protein